MEPASGVKGIPEGPLERQHEGSDPSGAASEALPVVVTGCRAYILGLQVGYGLMKKPSLPLSSRCAKWQLPQFF